jgi:hypothetical protein
VAPRRADAAPRRDEAAPRRAVYVYIYLIYMYMSSVLSPENNRIHFFFCATWYNTNGSCSGAFFFFFFFSFRSHPLNGFLPPVQDLGRKYPSGKMSVFFYNKKIFVNMFG